MTDYQGYYSITGLVPGTYTVSATKSGYTLEPVSASVVVGGPGPVKQDFSETQPMSILTISASASLHGQISPVGPIEVNNGASQAFWICPGPDSYIVDVLVDNVSVGDISYYLFDHVSIDHTIDAIFAVIGTGPPDIEITTASSIVPSTQHFFQLEGNVNDQVEGEIDWSNQTSGDSGSAMILEAGLIDRSTLTHNSISTNYGGAVALMSGGSIANSIMAENSANRFGGVLAVINAGGTVTNCTIVRNTAQYYGGGVCARYGGTFTNSIIYHNQAASGDNFYKYGSGMTVDYCAITPDPGGVENMTDDPLIYDPPAGDYRLRMSSPSINSGKNDYASGNFDVSGKNRIIEGIIDRGAWEYGAGPGSLVINEVAWSGTP